MMLSFHVEVVAFEWCHCIAESEMGA